MGFFRTRSDSAGFCGILYCRSLLYFDGFCNSLDSVGGRVEGEGCVV